MIEQRQSSRADDVQPTSHLVAAKHGIIAGFAMVLFTVGARLTWDALTITELAADWFTSVLPPEVIDFLLVTLSFSAKPLMFVGLLAAQVVTGGAAGVGYGAIARRWRVNRYVEWTRAFWFSLGLWLVSMAVLVPLFGGGFFGTSVRGGVTGFVLSSLAAFGVYGVALGTLFVRGEVDAASAPTHPARRSFLRQLGAWTLFSAIFVYGGKLLIDIGRSQMKGSGAFRTPGQLSAEITPNGKFYVISKNLIDPAVDSNEWTLEVAGLVDKPFTLTYDELRAMPSVDQIVTLECISNEVGGDLISNAEWRGVPLSDILERAGVGPDVVDISFAASDGYSESISLDRAREGRVLVAYLMNGVPLPPKHGYPARLIIPGFFGLKSVKWLTRIEPVDKNIRGFWQQRGWTDQPEVKTMSRIDTPASGTVHAPQGVAMGGVAFAGDRGVSAVELSYDEGQTWRDVDEISEPLSPYAWVIWKSELSYAGERRISPLVRATDGTGAVQTALRSPTLPDGATGRHRIEVEFGGQAG